MKQIKHFKVAAILLVLLSSMVSVVVMTVPQSALAAGCLANPATDTQATAQMTCVERYIDQCKKDFPKRKAVCEQLSAKQINQCAAKDGNKLKESCFKKIKVESVPAGEDCSDCLATEYDENDCSADSFDKLDGENCGVIGVILLITNVLSGLAGTVIVIMLIVGGIQYSMAGADASKVQAAKQKIYNALIALLLFVFGFGIVQWLVPGGIF